MYNSSPFIHLIESCPSKKVYLQANILAVLSRNSETQAVCFRGVAV